MASLREIAARAKWLLESGHNPESKCHFGLVGEEVQKRVENAPKEDGKRATRIVWESGDPDVYSLFHKERERYMQVASENPTLATELMILVLKLHSERELRSFFNALGPAKAAGGRG